MTKEEQEIFDELAGKYEFSAGLNQEEAEKKAKEDMEGEPKL